MVRGFAMASLFFSSNPPFRLAAGITNMKVTLDSGLHRNGNITGFLSNVIIGYPRCSHLLVWSAFDFIGCRHVPGQSIICQPVEVISALGQREV